jgi:hypothetical protein
MKTNKYFFTAMGFLTGTIFGITVFVFLSFTSGPAAPGAAMVSITPTQAHSYFSNYLSSAVTFNQVIKGFTIDKAQLEAMNSISGENPGLTAFRIYFGKDNNARNIAIVVGVDLNGKDAVKNTVFTTDSQKVSPCPPICDVSSPITLGN